MSCRELQAEPLYHLYEGWEPWLSWVKGQGGKIEDRFVEAGRQGIRNVMIYLGMLDGTVVQPQKQILITKRKFLRSDKGGLIQMCVKSGDTVKAGEALLKLHYYGQRFLKCRLKQTAL